MVEEEQLTLLYSVDDQWVFAISILVHCSNKAAFNNNMASDRMCQSNNYVVVHVDRQREGCHTLNRSTFKETVLKNLTLGSIDIDKLLPNFSTLQKAVHAAASLLVMSLIPETFIDESRYLKLDT